MKKNIKKVLSTAIISILLIVISCNPEVTVNEKLYPFFKVTSDGIVVIEGSNLTNVTVPDNLVDGRGNNVTTFKGFESDEDKSKIQNVTFENGITEVQSSAFQNASSLNTVTFEEGSSAKTIGNSAFEGSSLKEINIPSSVTNIGASAFQGTQNLETVTFEEGSNLERIESSTFSGSGLTSITLPDSVTTIGSNAFTNSKLEEINIPNTVEKIEDSAFTNVSLVTASIPASLTNSIKDSNIANSEKTLKNLTITYPGTENGKTIFQDAFTSFTALENVHIESGITTIESGAFIHTDQNVEPANIYLPSSITNAPKEAFNDDDNIFMSYDIYTNYSDTPLSVTVQVGPEDEKGDLYASVYSTLPLEGFTLESVYSLKEDDSFNSDSIAITGDKDNRSIAPGIPGIDSSYTSGRLYVNWIDGRLQYTANDTTESSYSVGLIDGEVGTELPVTISPTYNGKPVTTIKEGAFDIPIEVNVPKSNQITTIGDSAFEGNNRITGPLMDSLPNAETIGKNAFKDTGISGDVLNGGKITTVGEGAFQNSTGDLGNDSNILTIPESVTTIGNNAFDNTHGYTELTIPATLEKLGSNSFANTDLEKVTIADGTQLTAEEIKEAFGEGNTKVKDLSIPADLYNTDAKRTAINAAFPSLESITITGTTTDPSNKDLSFYGQGNLTSVDIAESVNIPLASDAFQNTKINDVTIPANAIPEDETIFSGTPVTSITVTKGPEGNADSTRIPDGAFKGATALESVTIGNGITDIGEIGTTQTGEGLFNNGENAPATPVKVTFEGALSDITTIGDHAFDGVAFPSDETGTTVSLDLAENTGLNLGEGAFANTNLTNVTLPDDIASIPAGLFEGTNSLTTADIPTTVTTIGDNAFKGTAISGDILKDNTALTEIGAGAFEGVTNNLGADTDGDEVVELTIPSTVTSIGANAFKDTKGYDEVSIPSSVASLGENAFANTDVTSVIIPSDTKLSAEDIAKAFGTDGTTPLTDSKVTSLTIPDYLYDTEDEKKVIDAAFPNITSIAISGATGETTQATGEISFADLSNLATITIDGSTDATLADGALAGTAVKDITLPANVLPSDSSTGDGIFSGDGVGITKVKVVSSDDENGKTIPDGAFKGASSLEEVEIGTGITTIGKIGDAEENKGKGLFDNGENAPTTPVKVTFEEGALSTIITIGDHAFDGVAFPSDETGTTVSLNLSENTGLALGDSAFANTNLTNVTLPDDIKAIPDGLFEGADNLTKADIPATVTTIGDNAFKGTAISGDILAEVSGLESIGAGAFEGVTGSLGDQNPNEDGNNELTIPDTVTTIGANAFKDTKGYDEVSIPSSVTNLGPDAFANTDVTSVIIPSDTTLTADAIAKAFGTDGTTTLTDSKVTSLTIPDYLYDSPEKKALIDAAFPNITSIAISGGTGSTTSGADGAISFEGLGSLTSVNIDGSTDAKLADGALSGTAVKDITLPANVLHTTAADGIFSGEDVQIEKVTIVKGDDDTTSDSTTIPDETFKSAASSLTDVVIGEGITTIGEIAGETDTPKSGLFDNNSNIAVTIPTSVTTIGDNAFKGNKGSISNAVEEGGSPSDTLDLSKVTSLGYGAFANTNLTDVKLPTTGIASIPDSLFEGATGLKVADIPTSVTTIGANAFKDTAISGDILKDNTDLTEIGDGAFEGVTGKLGSDTDDDGVVELTIPDTVTTIGDGAFSGTNGYTTINFDKERTEGLTIGANAFNPGENGTSDVTRITIPAEATNVGTNAFANLDKLTAVTVEEGAFTATPNEGATGNKDAYQAFIDAFGGDTAVNASVTTLSIPASFVDSADKQAAIAKAFPNVEKLTLTGSGSSNGSYNFDDFDSLKNLTIADTVKGVLSVPTNGSLFSDSTSGVSVKVPSSAIPTSDGEDGVFSGNAVSSIEVTTGPSGSTNATAIPDKAFKGADALTSVTIGSGITEVGKIGTSGTDKGIGLFDNREGSSLGPVEVTFADGALSGITTIGDNAFNGADFATDTAGGTTVSLDLSGNDGLNLGEGAFANTNLTKVTLPDDIASIPAGLFEGTESLNSINLDKITSIGADAFNGVGDISGFTGLVAKEDGTGVSEMTIPSSITAVGENAFAGTSGYTAVTVESTDLSADSIGKAFGASDSTKLSDSTVTSLTIPAKDYDTTEEKKFIDNAFPNVSSIELTGATATGGESISFAGLPKLESITLSSAISVPLADGAFAGCTSLSNISLPANMLNANSSSGSGIFSGEGVGIKTVTVSASDATNGKTISDGAFKGATSLEEVVIKEGITAIGTTGGSGLFDDNSGDIAVTIPTSVTTIGDNAFKGNKGSISNATETGSASDTLDLSKVTSLGDGAFADTALTKVDISSATTIPNNLFDGTSTLKEVTLSSGVTSIGDNAFRGTAISGDILSDLTSLKTIGDNAFANVSGYLGNQTVDGSGNKVLTIPDSVTSIGEGAFSGTNGYTTINFDKERTEGLTIGANAFNPGENGTSDVTSITIPAEAKNVGTDAFANLDKLTAVTVEEGAFTATPASSGTGDKEAYEAFIDAFGGDTAVNASVTTLSIPASFVDSADKQAAIAKAFPNVKELTLTGSGSANGSYNFDDFGALTSLTIEDGVEGKLSIPEGSTSLFKDGLTDVTVTVPAQVIPTGTIDGTSGTESGVFAGDEVSSITVNAGTAGTGATTIPDGAFKGATALDRVTIGNGITGVGTTENGIGLFDIRDGEGETPVKVAFESGSSVSGLTTIGDHAFEGASLATTDGAAVVVDLSNVTSLGDYAFADTDVTSATLPSSTQSVPNGLFSGAEKLTTVNGLNGVTVIGNDAFSSTALSGDILSGITGLQTIGDNAFANVSGSLGKDADEDGNKVLTIPSTVTSIGSGAFEGTKGYDSITISSAIETLGKDAFKDALDPDSSVVVADGTALTADTISKAFGFGDTDSTPNNNVTSLTIPTAIYDTEAEQTAINSAFPKLQSITLNGGSDATGANDGISFKGLTELTYVAINDTTGTAKLIGGAFDGTAITEITLPVSLIGESTTGTSGVFKSDNLKEVTINPTEKNSTVPDGIFKGSSALTSVEFGDGITTIGSTNGNGIGLFDDSLTGTVNVTIPTSVTTIGDQAFNNANVEVTIPEGNGITTVGKNAFAKNKTFGNDDYAKLTGLTSIGEGAFQNTSLSGPFTLSDDIISLGANAFEGNGITSVTVESGTEITGDALAAAFGYDSNNPSTSVSTSEVTSLTVPLSMVETPAEVDALTKAFPNITSLTITNDEGANDTTIPQNVSFSGFGKLTDLTLEGNITAIGGDSTSTEGSGPFANMSALTKVTLPEGLTTIGDNAFSGSAALTSVATKNADGKLPSTITSIGDGAFQNTALGSGSDNATTGGSTKADGTIDSESGLFSSITGSESLTIGDSAFEGTSIGPVVNLPDKTTSVGKSAFASLKDKDGTTDAEPSVRIPVEVINHKYTSGDNTGLYDIFIPSTETTARPIDNPLAFDRVEITRTTDTNLLPLVGGDNYGTVSASDPYITIKSVDIADGITTIEKDAFSHVNANGGAITIDLPSDLTTIGEGAFEGVGGNNGSLTITNGDGTPDKLPESVSSIGKDAFKDSGLTSSDNSGLGGTVGSSGIEGGLLSAITGELEIGDSAFEGTDLGSVINIPDNTTKVGDSAFAGTSTDPVSVKISVDIINQDNNDGASGASTGNTGLFDIFAPSSSEGSTVGDTATNPLKFDAVEITKGSDSKATELKPLVGGATDGTVTTTDPYISINTVDIADDITTIGDNAFAHVNYNGENLTVDLPKDLEKIGNGAFEGVANKEGDEQSSGSLVITNGKGEEGKLPSTVTSIGKDAFKDSGLGDDAKNANGGLGGTTKTDQSGNITDIEGGILGDIAGGLAIGDGAFANTNIGPTVNIPDSTQSIGSGAFSGITPKNNSANDDGINVKLPASLTDGNGNDGSKTGIDDYFKTLADKNPVKIDTLIISGNGNGNTTVGKLAGDTPTTTTGDVAELVLDEVIISSGVTEIGPGAFSGVAVDGDNTLTVTLPEGLTTIGEGAFQNAPLVADDSTGNITEGEGKLVISGDKLPSTVTTISDNAFKDSGLTDEDGNRAGLGGTLDDGSGNPTITGGLLDGLNGLTSIGESAFENTNIGPVVNIPDNVTSIGDHAFAGITPPSSGDEQKVSVKIPVDAINGEDTTGGSGSNKGLYDIFTPSTDPSSAPLVFDTIIITGDTGDTLKPLVGGNNSGNVTPSETPQITASDIVIDDDITKIAEDAFVNVGPNSDGTLTVDLPTSLTEIGAGAFEGVCDGTNEKLVIKDGSIPSSVTTIGDNAFKGSGLSGDPLAKATGVTSISDSAFEGTKIGDADHKITIPDSVTSIGNNAFAGIEGLVLEGGSIVVNGDGTITTNPGTINDGVKTIGAGAFSSATIDGAALVIPDSVTSIGDGAFNLNNDTNRSTPLDIAIGDELLTGEKGLDDYFTSSSDNTPLKVRNLYITDGSSQDPATLGSIAGDTSEASSASVILTGNIVIEAAETIGTDTSGLLDGVGVAEDSPSSGTYTVDITLPKLGSGEKFTITDLGSPFAVDSTGTSVSGAVGVTMNNGGIISAGDADIVISDNANLSTFKPGTSGNPFDDNNGNVSKITSIGENAFQRNTNIEVITIPKDCISIGANAFAECTSLKEIIFEGPRTEPITIADNAFSGCTGIKTISTLIDGVQNRVENQYIFPDNSVRAFTNGLFPDNGVGKVVLPSDVTSVSNDAFGDDTTFEITLPVNGNMNVREYPGSLDNYPTDAKGDMTFSGTFGTSVSVNATAGGEGKGPKKYGYEGQLSITTAETANVTEDGVTTITSSINSLVSNKDAIAINWSAKSWDVTFTTTDDNAGTVQETASVTFGQPIDLNDVFSTNDENTYSFSNGTIAPDYDACFDESGALISEDFGSGSEVSVESTWIPTITVNINGTSYRFPQGTTWAEAKASVSTPANSFYSTSTATTLTSRSAIADATVLTNNMNVYLYYPVSVNNGYGTTSTAYARSGVTLAQFASGYGNPTRTGWTFSSWTYSHSSSTQVRGSGYTITANWTPNVGTQYTASTVIINGVDIGSTNVIKISSTRFIVPDFIYGGSNDFFDKGNNSVSTGGRNYTIRELGIVNVITAGSTQIVSGSLPQSASEVQAIINYVGASRFTGLATNGYSYFFDSKTSGYRSQSPNFTSVLSTTYQITSGYVIPVFTIGADTTITN